MGGHVFICYSREDEDFVLKLATNLKNHGVPVWLDQWDIPSGANWNRTIERALNDCDSQLVVLSPASVRSDEVQSEWLAALDEKKVVIPILYQTCRMPFRLNSIQYIDFTSRGPDNEEAIGEILNALVMSRSIPKEPVVQLEQSPNNSAESQTIVKHADLNKKVVTVGIFMAIVFLLILFNAYQIPTFIPDGRSTSQNVVTLTSEGNALYSQGQYDEALQAFDKAIEIGPQYSPAWHGKGWTLENLGRYEEALQAFDKAIEIDPQYTLAWDGKGWALNSLGRFEEALQAFDKAIEISPQYGDAWYGKGWVILVQGLENKSMRGQYNEAVIAFDKAIEIDPQNAYYWYGKGGTLNGLGRFEEALQAFDKAIEISPQYSSAWDSKGWTLNSLGIRL